MPQYRNLERPWLISAVLVLAVFAAYLPVCYLGFINFDDTYYVTRNPYVQGGLTLDGVRWAFTKFYVSNWHPLTWLSHMLDCQLYGLNPLGHHVTNVVFHAANTVILFLWLRSMTGAVWRGALVAAFFGLHPLRVESVAWVAERKDVLGAFFGLLTLWAYSEYARARMVRNSYAEAAAKIRETKPKPTGGRPVLFYLAAFVLFALGLLSKPMLVTWPFVMLLLDYWPIGRMTRQAEDGLKSTPAPGVRRILALVAEKLPFFILSAASCVITFLAQRAGGAVSSLEGTHGVSLASRIGNVPISYVRYLWKLAWPHDLAIIYPFDKEWAEEQMAAAVVLLLVVTSAALWRARRNPYFPTGWFWYLGTMVPVIGLVQVGTQSIADRYTYLPAIGLLIVLVWGVADFAARWGRSAGFLSVAATAVLALFVYVDGRQLLYWQNSETLFRHALAVTRNNYMAELELGSYLSGLGDIKPAEARYRAALEVAPDFPSAWNNLGCALLTQKHYEEAVEAFQKALQAKPLLADAHSNLGNALVSLGRVDEALEHYRESVRIEPGNALAQYNLGAALIGKDQLAEALDHLRLSVKLDSRYADSHGAIANVLVRQGHLDEAAEEYRRALAIAPSSLSALYGYGSVLAGQGKWNEAAAQYSAILRQVPNDNQARVNLGITEAALGKPREAMDIFSAVLQANPNDATANYHVAAVLQEEHRFKDAIRYYQAAVKDAPDFAEPMNNLAWILASNPDPELRNGPEAVSLAEKACELTQYKQAVIVGTLAAAYAEAGRFPEAVRTGEKAKALADAAGDKELSRRNAELLDIYRSGKPYRDAR